MSAGIAIFLYILLHEFGHMIIMLSVGATITDFSIFTAHVSADGGNYTDLSGEIVNEFMDCAIVLMVDTLPDSIREYYNASEVQIAELVCLFISKLPENWKNRFQVPKVA